MNILTYGYAIGGISAEEVKQLIKKAATANENIKFVFLDENLPYEQWMGHDVEIKNLIRGTYLETEFKLSDSILSELSKKTNGVLSLFYAQNMGGYGCSYFLNGQKLLERLTILEKNMKNEEKGNEFADHTTKQVIEQILVQLVGLSIKDICNVKGEMYMISD
jgi:hypothetical protein